MFQNDRLAVVKNKQSQNLRFEPWKTIHLCDFTLEREDGVIQLMQKYET